MSSPLKSVAFSPDGKRVIPASYDNTIRVWIADNSSGSFEGHIAYVSPVAFSPTAIDVRYTCVHPKDGCPYSYIFPPTQCLPLGLMNQHARGFLPILPQCGRRWASGIEP
jgi:hypothetical protein